MNRLRNEPYRPRSSLGSSLSRSTPQLVETALRTPRRKETRRTMDSPAPAKITRPLNDDINYTPRKSSSRIRPAKSTSNLSAVSTESRAKQRRKRLKPDVRVEITLHLKLIILTNKKLISPTISPTRPIEKGGLSPSKSLGNLSQKSVSPSLSVFDRLYSTRPSRKPRPDSAPKEQEVFLHGHLVIEGTYSISHFIVCTNQTLINCFQFISKFYALVAL